MTASADTADAMATPAGDSGGAQVVQMPPPRQTGQITRSPYGFAPTPPQSITSFVAGIAEPLLSVLALLLITTLVDEPIDRATQLLSLGVLVLTFPGTNRFHATPWVALSGIVSSWLVVCSVLALVGFATDSIKFYTPEVLAAWLVAAPLLHFGLALTGHALLRHMARNPALRRAALVIGAGDIGQRMAEVLRERAAVGYDFVGFIEDRDLDRVPGARASEIKGKLAEIREVITRHGVRDAYITLPLGAQPRITQLVSALQDAACTVYFVPDVMRVQVIQGRVRNIDGVPVVGLLESPFIGTNALLKRASDIVLSALILLLIAPIMLSVALGIKLSSPGPVIFKQRRHGLDGREIVIYKFRSMTTMDNGAVVRQATRNDARITPFGRFLRRTSLDELPQFINVLQGRMSIVGPRPHALAHNQQYRELIKSYMVRHKVRPGITGWAQVNGSRGETDTTDKMAERVRLDLEYLRNWSLALDLRIIVRTAFLAFFDRNAY
ncbi:undecaprenyl-phosphate glucose phosphotransferase [Sphaerotilus mobilis]|uniref:Putative colanic acid biosynthesis UDP-glucose lipid carrier transferase n=1 Tax=Sphaerotilus mobilis TaxID=47994 RepID=A0A4V2EWU3_9BURK|nr:undecaprenyl-phosphate glucose phosphotransferase [Sphaerotilus mobilis]RZS57190.1 putative colanic acid biosynthesis UDP-glucose lipid carrier transferase [Sphaerotilus mobilis]